MLVLADGGSRAQRRGMNPQAWQHRLRSRPGCKSGGGGATQSESPWQVQLPSQVHALACRIRCIAPACRVERNRRCRPPRRSSERTSVGPVTQCNPPIPVNTAQEAQPSSQVRGDRRKAGTARRAAVPCSAGRGPRGEAGVGGHARTISSCVTKKGTEATRRRLVFGWEVT